MVFAFIYVLIGTTICYFSRKRVREISAQITPYVKIQPIIEIQIDALISITWIVAVPLYIVFRLYKRNKK